MGHETHTQHTRTRNGLQLSSRLILFAFLAIGGFFLITEHTAHLFGVVPYLLVLLCPLLHLLHGGHGGHDSQHRQEKGDARMRSGSSSIAFNYTLSVGGEATRETDSALRCAIANVRSLDPIRRCFK